MRARSWMAALALVVGTSIAVGRAMPALETSQTPEKSEAKKTDKSEMRPERRDRNPKTEGTAIPSVDLNLVIAGLGVEGCDIEVKPGNASCKFRPIYGNGKREASRQHVASGGRASVELRDVELRGAERTFTVAITVREGDQASKTFYRGFRLPNKPESSAGGKGTSTPAFTCYLSSPSKLAKAEESRTRK
jgi:hypothetical protein